MNPDERKPHTKPKTLRQLWDGAYKVSHVLADITKKARHGEVDEQWLLESAREMNSLALAIRNQSKGIKRDEVS